MDGTFLPVQRGRGGAQRLKHTAFANLDHLYAFNCSAEDARVLAPELGGRTS